MTKFKNFPCGKYTFKAYCKPVGHGYEVGLRVKDRPVFVGNFVHKDEAQQWWKTFCSELEFFFDRYEYSPETPFNWYTEFCTNTMYSTYYSWLDKVFKKHTKTFEKAAVRDMRMYKKYQKDAPPTWAPRRAA